MSRRRRQGGQTVASKAAPTDADVLAGTVADSTAKRLSDREQYWYLFKRHPWVRACVRIIGNAVAQEGYELAPVDYEETLDPNDDNVKALHVFLRVGFVGKCNTFRKFRKTIVMDQQINATGYARRKMATINGKRQLVAIERMDWRRITPHLNSDKSAIDYYVLKKATSSTPDSIVAQAAQQFAPGDQRDMEKIPADEMIAFTLDEGGDDILPSPSPLEALDLTCYTDLSVRNHRSSFFRNGTQTGNILTSKTASDDQVRDLQKKLKLQAGGSNAFRNIAAGGDWDVKSLLASGGRDFDFIKGSELTLEEICAVFGVPPSKLRDVSGSMGQAGKGEDDETFEQECVLPIEECFYETLTIEVLEKEFEIDYFSIVPARRNKVRLARFAAAAQLVKFGGSGNQALQLVGYPKVDDPEMDRPRFMGSTGAPDEVDEPQPAPTQMQKPGNVTQREDIDDENTDATKARGRKSSANPKGWL